MQDRLNEKSLNIINYILTHFNFAKVHAYMTMVKWEWWDGEGPNKVPTIEQLKIAAKDLLIATYNEKGGRQTGGFVTEYFDVDGTEYLHLHFAIESQFDTTMS